MKNTQINRAEVARCTLSESCSTDLDYRFFFDWVDVFLAHVRRTLKASEGFLNQTSPSFLFISLVIWLP